MQFRELNRNELERRVAQTLYNPQAASALLIGCHLSPGRAEKRQLVCACSVKIKLMRETAEVRLC